MYRRVAVGWIKQVPVAGRKLGHKRQNGVAEQSSLRHFMDFFQIKKAVPLRIIGMAKNNRRGKMADQVRIHVTIAIDFYDDLHIIGNSLGITGHYSAAHAQILTVPENLDPPILTVFFDKSARTIGTAIVYDIDSTYFGTYFTYHIQNM